MDTFSPVITFHQTTYYPLKQRGENVAPTIVVDNSLLVVQIVNFLAF